MGTGNLWSLVLFCHVRVSRHIDLYVGWTPPPRRECVDSEPPGAAGVNYMNLFVVALARALEVLLDVLGQLEHLEPLHPK